MEKCTWIELILRTIEHFKEVLNISSAQMQEELQYFFDTNNFSLVFLVSFAIYHSSVVDLIQSIVKYCPWQNYTSNKLFCCFY